MKREDSRKITVEDLIRLKRAERPPAEFWARFESEMRAKQLSAIVGRRTVWDGLYGAFAILRRSRLPFGAAAAAAVAWAGYHYVGVDSPAAVHAASSRSLAKTAPARLEQALVQKPRAPESVAARAPAPVPSAIAEARRDLVTVGSVSHVSPAPVSSSSEAPARTPFSDSVSAMLADFHQAMPDTAVHGMFGADREFEAAAQAPRLSMSEPLLHTDPLEVRRSRLLESALPSATRLVAGDPTKVHGDSERIYESMDRYESNERSVVGFRF